MILIDNGYGLKIISSIALDHLKIPQIHLSCSTLQLRAFNDIISTFMGTIVLPLYVDPRTLHTLFHVIEGSLHYNILLGIPWINEMRCVPSTLHQYFKFIHEGKMCCIKVYPKPFQHGNFIPSPHDIILSSIHLVELCVTLRGG